MAIGLLWLGAGLWGQTPASSAQSTLAAYEGQSVTAVEIVGWPKLNPTPLLAQLEQQSGKPLSGARVAASLDTLKAALTTGATAKSGPEGQKLQGITVQIVPQVGGVELDFVLKPADYFGVFTFPGASRFSYSRLLEAAGYESETPYNGMLVATGRLGLIAYFRQQGFFQASVEPQTLNNAPAGLVNVAFRTNLGPPAKFGTIAFQGATAAQAKKYGSVLGSIWARLHRASVRTGAGYSYAGLQSATQYLQSWLNGQGYLSAQVSFAGADYVRKTNRANINFEVQTGPPVKIKIDGAHLWPWTRHSLLPMYQESRVDPELIQEGQNNLVNYFSQQGYFSAKVTATVGVNGKATTTQASAADLSAAQPLQASGATQRTNAPTTVTYHIDKGPRHDVEEIQFEGNHAFSDQELMAQVKIQQEHFLSHGAFNQELLRNSVDNLEALYQASGYSNVKVTPVIAHPGGNLAVTFHIVEGPQDYVGSLSFEGKTVPTAKLAPKGLRLQVGAPYSEQRIAQDRAQILAQYYSLGYLNATFRATAEAMKGHAHEIAVVYRIDEGPQVRITKVVRVGAPDTQQRYVDRLTRNLKPGHLLTENAMLAAESNLYAPGVFDWTDVGPIGSITDQRQSEVVVKLHQSPRNTLIYGFGFDVTNRGGSIPSGTVALPGLPVVGLPNSFKTSQASYFGPNVTVQYTRSDLFGRGVTLSVGGYAGRLDQRGSIAYTDPYFNWSKFAADLEISAEHNATNPIFTAREEQFSYQLERALNPDATTNLFLRYSYNQTRLTQLLIPDLVPAQDRSVRLSTLSATFLRDTRDNPLDAHKGFLESYELDYNPSALGSSANFVKFNSQTAYYRSLNRNMVWANSIRFGFEHAFGNSFVPLSQAFFSGGANTLRGFPLNGAGPQRSVPVCSNPSDPSTCTQIRVPVGGRALFIVNSELRVQTPWLYPNVGFAVFYDGGNVFSHLGFSNLGASYTNSVGVGLRYETPVGPIRFDVGHNLSPIAGISPTQYFITLGQAF